MKHFLIRTLFIPFTLILVSCGQLDNRDDSEVSSTADCNRAQLDICLQYGGGQACYEKWSCTPDQEPSGAAFGDYYKNNYRSIASKAEEFFSGSYSCAAFASTAFKMAGFKVRQVTVTNDVESQLISLGWSKITNLRKLQKGDVVFATKEGSNIPGTYAHVFVFQSYAQGTSDAWVTDNYGQLTQRNLFEGPRSPAVHAFRHAIK